MQKDDIALIEMADIAAAVGLLTRLPVRVDTTKAMARGAQAAWAYPLAGVVVAVLAACLGTVMLALDVPVPIVAGAVLACSAFVTGAMHEDGLADCADGFWGGWNPSRRLEIMKDSAVGVYGLLALVLAVLLRWQALVLIIDAGMLWAAVVATATTSRAGMVVLMNRLQNPRDNGLSRSVGRPSTAATWIAVGIAGLIAMTAGLPNIILWSVIGTILCGVLAYRKIGGQTGDVLGATQQVTEILALCAIAASLS